MNKLYIGIGGISTCGKDLCGKIISNILQNKGYKLQRFAFADELKNDIDAFCKEKYKISAWTTNPEEKKIIRPILVAHGCIMRKIQPDYWIKRIEPLIDVNNCNVVILTDVRFTNEVKWLKYKEGWFIHIKKYTKESPDAGRTWQRIYKQPPNEEEKENDPQIQLLSDYKINWEDLGNNGTIKVNVDELVYNPYLNEEVLKSLEKCPTLHL